MLAVGDTLVVGLSGRLVGLNPAQRQRRAGRRRWQRRAASTTSSAWSTWWAASAGWATSVCARAFQASVGCVDAARGAVLWTKPANGAEGVHRRRPAGVRHRSRWQGRGLAPRQRRARLDQRTGSSTAALTAPLALGRSVIVGDSTGLVHMLSREDGSLLNRLTTDGSADRRSPGAWPATRSWSSRATAASTASCPNNQVNGRLP